MLGQRIAIKWRTKNFCVNACTLAYIHSKAFIIVVSANFMAISLFLWVLYYRNFIFTFTAFRAFYCLCILGFVVVAFLYHLINTNCCCNDFIAIYSNVFASFGCSFDCPAITFGRPQRDKFAIKNFCSSVVVVGFIKYFHTFMSEGKKFFALPCKRMF